MLLYPLAMAQMVSCAALAQHRAARCYPSTNMEAHSGPHSLTDTQKWLSCYGYRFRRVLGGLIVKVHMQRNRGVFAMAVPVA